MTQAFTTIPAYNMQYAPQYGYMPQQAPQSSQLPSVNAVKIDIHQPTANQAPQQGFYNPYAMPMNSAYAPLTPMPAAQFPTAVNYLPQQAVSVPATIPAPIPAAPTPMPAPVVTEAPKVTQVINNAPVPPAAIPAPVVQTPTVVMPTPVAAPTEATTTETPAVTQQEEAKAPEVVQPKVEEPSTTPVNINIDDIVSNVNSTDPETQLKAIETIAETAQSGSENAKQLLDSRIMDSLGGVIKRDTTKMQAPTPEQLKLRQRQYAGETLTPEEDAKAKELSEMEIAEKNKQYSLFTVAILQKLLAAEVEKAQGTKLELNEYPMINDVVNVAKSDENPMLRASALASLSFIADPSNKDLLAKMFKQSTKDADPNVRQVAEEALNKLSQLS